MYALVDIDTQTEFYPITDVQLVKDVTPRVCETTNFQVLVMSRVAAFITRCSFSVVDLAHQPAGSWNSKRDWKRDW